MEIGCYLQPYGISKSINHCNFASEYEIYNYIGSGADIRCAAKLTKLWIIPTQTLRSHKT